MDLNCKGTYLLSKHLLPENRAFQIINYNSENYNHKLKDFYFVLNQGGYIDYKLFLTLFNYDYIA